MISFGSSILLIGNGWFPLMPGGLNRYVYEFLAHSKAENSQLELCAVGLPTLNVDPLVGLTNLADPKQFILHRLFSSYFAFNNRIIFRPDVVNLHFALYSLPLLKKIPRNIPVVFTFHGPWALESEQESASSLSVQIKSWIERKVYNRCDRFIVLSKAFGDILHHEYNISWNKIHIIPGGVDTIRFQSNLLREEARAQLNWPQDRKILFTPRRLVYRMGIDKLLLALSKIRHSVPEVWLAIAGKGPLRSALEQQAQDLGLINCVKFLGYLPDEQLPIAYQAADLTVVPSQALEGFGLILLESLACGTPVLCTPVGGMPEILTPFSTDLITQGVDEKAIAERLLALLSGDFPLPTREQCREYAVTNYDWRMIAQRVREVLLAEK